MGDDFRRMDCSQKDCEDKCFRECCAVTMTEAAVYGSLYLLS